MQARNTNDWGEISEMNNEGGIISIVPFKMQAPTRGSLTTTSSLEVYWLPLLGSDTGSA
jgi:hypothetical protein